MTDETPGTSAVHEPLAGALARARRILVFTGAGVSTGSGIPDFRGPEGVWRRRKPVYFDDFLASASARLEHWDYKLESWPAFRDALPNAAHGAVAELARAGRLEGVVTQNIDGLHARAGLPESLLVEIHGTNLRICCVDCGALSEANPVFEVFAATRRPPTCPRCGGWLKPATISFGQSLDPGALARAEAMADSCDLVVALGSSLGVYPAADIPLRAARRGVPYGVVNRGPTDHDGLPEVSFRVEGDVVDVLPPAVRAALGEALPG